MNLFESDKPRIGRRSTDYIENVFQEAPSQIGKKKKKEREQLSILEEFLREDFFDGNTGFKITKIISGGYEGYYWNVEIIIMPNMNNINTKNFEHAYDGMFVFGVKEDKYAWVVNEKSYKIEDIAKYIREYFGLDKVNNDEY